MPAAVAQVGTDILKDLAKEAVQKQLQIIQEQQKKAMDFVNKKVSSSCKLTPDVCYMEYIYTLSSVFSF